MSLLKPLSAISHLTLKCLTGIVSKFKNNLLGGKRFIYNKYIFR